MQNDIESTLRMLAGSGVRFIVVGGVAVVLHGYLRLTADLDVVIQLDEANLHRAVQAFKAASFVPRAPVTIEDFADSAKRRSWIVEKQMQVLSLWSRERPGLEVDVFVEEPFDFDAVFARAMRLRLEGADIAVVGINDLIALKRVAGRPRDLEDIAALEALKETRRPDEKA